MKNKEKAIQDLTNLNFGSKELIVSDENLESAKKDVESLEIQAKFKKQIITGHLFIKRDDLDVSYKMPERDFNIICALIKADYNYPTIRSIFFNEHLMCSERIREKGEETLIKEVKNAMHIVDTEKLKGKTFEQRAVAFIKRKSGIKNEEKLRLISDFIKSDLLTKEEPAGKGFVDEEKDIAYYFHKEDKTLMEIDERHIAGDFYYFVRDKYDITRIDYCEVRDTIVTEIRIHGNKIRAHKFSYYDDQNHVLYVSNHKNQIYKLNGKNIEIVDNGTDGVFFEFSTEFTPFNIDLEKLEGVNYFEKGFSPLIFEQKNPYLKQYLIEKTNFAYEEKKGLTIENQKDILVIYFYSLFFESLMTDKPIICFVGRKASGKSTLSALMGKILFGNKYSNQSLPDDPKDLATVLGDSYYIVFDNVDHHVKKNILDIICASIEATAAKKRMLFTDRDVVRIVPHVFMGFTTREAKFKRDDLVSRLLLFNTQKVAKVIPKRELYKDIEENRDKIMAEVLVNLSSIVTLLKEQKNFKPRCISRVADWEAFGIKVNRWFHWASYFRSIMEGMGEEKDIFTIEDDYIYQVLEEIVINNGYSIDCDSAAKLYDKLSEKAEKELKIKDFSKYYKSPRSLANRLTHIKDELNRVMNFETRPVRGGRLGYFFAPLEEKPEEEEELKENKEEVAPELKRKTKKKKSKKEKEEEIKKKVERIRAKHEKKKKYIKWHKDKSENSEPEEKETEEKY